MKSRRVLWLDDEVWSKLKSKAEKVNKPMSALVTEWITGVASQDEKITEDIEELREELAQLKKTVRRIDCA